MRGSFLAVFGFWASLTAWVRFRNCSKVICLIKFYLTWSTELIMMPRLPSDKVIPLSLQILTNEVAVMYSSALLWLKSQ